MNKRKIIEKAKKYYSSEYGLFIKCMSKPPFSLNISDQRTLWKLEELFRQGQDEKRYIRLAKKSPQHLFRIKGTLDDGDGEIIERFFDTRQKAEDFLLDYCCNGTINRMAVMLDNEYGLPINYSDGCTKKDLCYGNLNELIIAEL